MFQKLIQEKFSITPHYAVTEESGPDHDKHFIMQVMVGDRCVGQGFGSSKKDAEKDATADALRKEFGKTSHLFSNQTKAIQSISSGWLLNLLYDRSHARIGHFFGKSLHL